MSALVPSAAVRPVLADLVPGARVRNAILVVGATLFTALCAQISIPLGFSPVPITGQTFAVLLTAAALGPVRALSAQGLYILLGTAGLPFYAGGESGWQVISGATGGYIIGWTIAAMVVGYLARRGLDRTVHGTLLAYAVGTVIIYAIGLPWLAVTIDVSLAETIPLGLTPFLIGDALKALLAAGFLPSVWKLVNRGA